MEKLKKYLVIIVCAVALVALFMPYASVVVESYWDDFETTVNGITIAFKGYVALVLILGPAALIMANLGTIPILKKMEEALLIVVPIINFVIALIAYAQATKIAVASDGFEDYGVDVYAKLGIGAIIIIACNIGLFVYGVITNKSVKLNKNFVNSVVECVTNALNSESVSQAEQNSSKSLENEYAMVGEQVNNQPSNDDEYTLG